MRSLGWVTILALVAPAAAAFDLLAERAEELPEGCARESTTTLACVWTVTFGPGSNGFFTSDLPAPGRAILDVIVEAERPPPYGWRLLRNESFVTGGCSGCPINSVLNIEAPTGQPGSQEWRNLVEAYAGSTLAFVLNEETSEVLVTAPATLRVQLLLVTLPQGVAAPSVPAATADDPHVLDRAGDAEGDPWNDIIAAWFDDSYLDDDLVEVHVNAPLLSEFDPEEAADRPFYRVRWTLLGDSTELDWNLLRVEGDWRWTAHVHHRFVHSQERPCGYEAGPEADLIARFDEETGTLSAWIPLSFIGDPDPHARFTNISAQSFGFPDIAEVPVQGVACGFPVVFDDATDNVRPFAVGGPEVWRELRGAPAVAAPDAAPWYRDPLAPDNVPDTLSAVSVLGAIGTAGGGYVLLRRRRARMHTHIAEVDAAFGLHATDAEAALKALEDLEHRFDQMMLDGKLDEKQHDLLARRIERSAYKILKLRRG